MTVREALRCAERAHCASYAHDTGEEPCYEAGVPYPMDAEYRKETIYAVNRHNDIIIGKVMLDGTVDWGISGLGGLHVSHLSPTRGTYLSRSS